MLVHLRPGAVALGVLSVLAAAVATLPAAAQEPATTSSTVAGPTSTSSTSSTMPGSSTTTTSEPGSTTTAVDPSTTTTAAPTTTLPPAPPVTDPGVEIVAPAGFLTEEDAALYEALDGAGDARTGYYLAQPAFDPLVHNAVLEAELDGARADLALAEAAHTAAEHRVVEARAGLAGAEARVGALGELRAARVGEALVARDRLRARAADAYVRGGGGVEVAALTGARSGSEAAQRVGLLQAVLLADLDAARAAEAATAELDGEEVGAARQLEVARADLLGAEGDLDLAAWDRLAADSTVRMYEAGSHVAVAGFVFPVAGDVGFIDSFGAPRNTGTEWEHWHEGTDIMAARGTPVVAAEDGVIVRAVPNRLGGNALRLRGDSGHGYYYAHLDAYAPGITSGTPVTAGQLLGVVGDTGDARGGAPHLHFEVHRPGDDEPVNPYPLLRVAWEAAEAAMSQVDER